MTTGTMRKKENLTICSAIPAFIPRKLAIDVLHNHSEVITLNPLVTDHRLISPPRDAGPDEYGSTWYEITERIQYIPGIGKMGSGKIQFNGCFHDVPWGLQTHIYAPMNVDMRAQYRVAGNKPGMSATEPRELGLSAMGAPAEGLYIRADIEFTCNITLSAFVRSQSKSAIQEMVKRMVKKAEKLDADVLNKMFEQEQMSSSQSQLEPDATDEQKRYILNTNVPNLQQQRNSFVAQPVQSQQRNSLDKSIPQPQPRRSQDSRPQQVYETYGSNVVPTTSSQQVSSINSTIPTQPQQSAQYNSERRPSYNGNRLDPNGPLTSRPQRNPGYNDKRSNSPLPSQRKSSYSGTATPPNQQYIAYNASNQPSSQRRPSYGNTYEAGPLPSQKHAPYADDARFQSSQQQQQPQSETRSLDPYPTKNDLPPPPPPTNDSSQPWSQQPYPYPHYDPYTSKSVQPAAVELPANDAHPAPLRVQKQM